MKPATAGNEFRELVQAIEAQHAHADKVKARHKRRKVAEEPKHHPTTPRKSRYSRAR